MNTIDSAVVLEPPQFLELLASGGEGPRVLDTLGITAEDLPLSQAITSKSNTRVGHKLAAIVATASEHIQVIAPVGETRSLFGFRADDTCAVFLMGESDTQAVTCSPAEATELIESTIDSLKAAHVDWSLVWHSDGATYEIYVRPDGSVEGDPPATLQELLGTFAA